MSEGVSPAGKLPGSNPDSATPASSPARQRAGLACRGAGTLRAGGVAWQGALGAVGGGCFTISRMSGARGSPAACPQGPVCFIACQPRCRFQTDSVDHTWIAQHRFGRGREGALPWRRPLDSWRPCVLVPSIRGAATLAQTLVGVCSPC